METGPHEEGAYATKTGEDVSDVSSAHSPNEDMEESADDEEDARQSKWAQHSKGESVSASLPTKQVSNPEVNDTGSSSSSVKEQTALQYPLNVEPLDFAPPSEFGRLPSVSVGSSEEELR